MNNNTKITAKTRITPAQQMIYFLDKKAPPNVAITAVSCMLPGLLAILLSNILPKLTLFKSIQPQSLSTLGFILIVSAFTIIYGAKLQRIHYRLDK